MTAADAWGQRSHRVRCEWGPVGGAAIATGADVAVVIDVLSFTTTVTVALDLGVAVLPYRWRDATAAAFAADHDATLAVGRSEARGDGISLSPRSLHRAAARDELPARLVLPSPNGATIAHGLAGAGVTVVAASLRNAAAVARWLHAQGPDTVVAVVPAGERWPDESLHPAVEDLWGAGAVIAALGGSCLSPEAEAAVAAYRTVEGWVSEALTTSASGRELTTNGYPDDVRAAGEIDASSVVPVLRDGVFSPGR